FDTGLDVEDFRLTLAHEMFHTRSPYIVNPPGLASQWFAEGLAVFYQRVLPRRFRLIDAQRFLDDVNYHAGRYFTNALGGAPYAQVPLRFWEDTRIRTIPYDRGSFYFVILDQALRRHSSGRRSLDDLVFELRRRERGGAKLALADWEALLRAELGEAAVQQFRGMLAGEWQVPEPDAFGPCFRRTRTPLRRYELGFEPKVLTEQPRIVRGLIAGSAAERAGLRNGDEILRPVGQDGIQGEQARELELQVRRDGRDQSIRYLPRGETVDAWQWEHDPAAAGMESCRH
ncbi:MAG: peptidase M61, partial [Gammaproteobacteria bacterium]|nr:peptidase M61 [Gammaproteobacteria bacterium]